MNEKPTLRDWLWIKPELDYSKRKWLGGFIAFLLGLLMIAGLIIAGALILRLLGTMVGYPILGQTDTDAAIRNLGLAVVAIFSAPFLAWRTMIAQNQANTAEQGHITDRINTAVQGLGAEKTVKRDGEESTEPNLEVRIGAIYGLERIAQDSARDHIQIMEILCAYIRQNAPAKEAVPYPFKEGETPTGDEIRAWAYDLPAPRTDIQVTLEVIGRRSEKQISLERAAKMRNNKKGYHLDLRETNLQCTDVGGLDFEDADFRTVVLQGANLTGTRLRGTSLRQAKLQGAFLASAMLQGADLAEARLQGAALILTDLRGASLEAVLFDTPTAVIWAKLRGASVKFIDFTDNPITTEEIDSMFGDASVILPAGIPRPDHWATEKLGLHDFETQWRAWQKSIGFTLPKNTP